MREEILEKFLNRFFFFLTIQDEIEKYVQLSSSDNCVHHYNVEILNLFYLELEL